MEIGQIVTAWFLPVLDCDETFNYWEPLHYLQYGNGLQVWEYSPQYGLRSYFFLILHFLVFYPLLLLPKVFVYRLSRVLLTIFSIFCQKFLVSSADLPEITKVLFSSTTGILLASHTLLPSTFSMNFIMLALGFFARFLKNRSNWSFLGFFLSCSFAMVVGWPFVAVIFLGFILPYLGKYPSSLLNPKVYLFGGFSLGITVFISYLCDSYFYKTPTLSVLNVLLYNTSLGKNLVGNSLLFGIEPWYLYISNLFLNFNLVIFIQVFLLFLGFPVYLIQVYKSKKFVKGLRFYFSVWLSSILWFLLMSSQPHKEERFMYVIYPGIVISSSLVLTRFPRILQKIVVFCVVLVSFSRVLQVYQAYSAPLKVWQMVSGDVCVGRDWYLFPSSYFLDGELRFYQDGFKGLLPGNFGKEFKMNDRNQEEVDRYFDFEYCDFVVTLNVSEKNVRSELKEWEVKGIEKYIDSQTRQPFRSFFIYPPKVVYGEYLALANKNRSK